MNKIRFYIDTALAHGLVKLCRKLEEINQLKTPVSIFVAGGIAVSLYTGDRVTTDVDAEFSKRLMVPDNIFVSIMLEDGKKQDLFFDTNYNSTFGLMHEDYIQDALPLPLKSAPKYIQIYVLSPLDLAVSKVARLAENDRKDIATLASHGLINSEELQQRCDEARLCFVGGQQLLEYNIRDAVNIVRGIELNLNQDIERESTPGL